MSVKKKPRKLSLFNRKLLEALDAFKKEKNVSAPYLYEAARWAYDRGLADAPEIDIIRIIARAMLR